MLQSDHYLNFQKRTEKANETGAAQVEELYKNQILKVQHKELRNIETSGKGCVEAPKTDKEKNN